jgi:hypothetical protein
MATRAIAAPTRIWVSSVRKKIHDMMLLIVEGRFKGNINKNQLNKSGQEIKWEVSPNPCRRGAEYEKKESENKKGEKTVCSATPTAFGGGRTTSKPPLVFFFFQGRRNRKAVAANRKFLKYFISILLRVLLSLGGH